MRKRKFFSIKYTRLYYTKFRTFFVRHPVCDLFIDQCVDFYSVNFYAVLVAVVLKPPYEVTETGWGEFEVIIKIYFNDPTERPVNCIGLLCNVANVHLPSAVS